VAEPLRQAKRIIKIVFGFTLLMVGVALLVLPGPGWVIIFFALALLATEFVWAQRLLDRLKNTAGQVKRAAGRVARRRPE